MRIFLWIGITCLLTAITGCSPKTSNESLSLLQEVRNEKYSQTQRLRISNTLDSIMALHPEDSVTRLNLLEMTRLYYALEDWNRTIAAARKNVNLGMIAKDSLILSKSLNYLGNSYLNMYRYDSAYHYFYKSSQIFKKRKDSLGEGKALLNMSIIEKNKGDFITAMNTSVKVEKLLTPSRDIRLLASLYNNMGIVSQELKNYESSERYYKKSLELRNSLVQEEPMLRTESLNNIAVLFQHQKKYDSCLLYLKLALKFPDLKKHPKQYAAIKDNLGYTCFLSGSKGQAYHLMTEAQKIRTKNADTPGRVVSFLHLADYFSRYDPDKSQSLLDSALLLSHSLEDSRDIAVSLKNHVLVSHPNDIYLKKMLAIHDSILDSRTKNPNQLARIRYETDVLSQQKKQVQKEIREKKNQLFNQRLISILLLFIVILITFLIYGIYRAYKNQQNLYSDFNHRTRNYLGHILRQILKIKATVKSVNGEVSIPLKELENTVITLNLVYSMLEQQDIEGKYLSLKVYLPRLIEQLVRSFQKPEVQIQYGTVENIEIHPRQATVIGLVCNEFITNAYKYAFQGEETSHFLNLKIFSTESESICITLEASGPYWNIEQTVQKGNINGLKIMESLLRQIKARHEISYRENKTILQLQIPSKRKSNLFNLWQKFQF